MQPSLLLRIPFAVVILALTTTAFTLWLFRCSLLGLIGMTRGKGGNFSSNQRHPPAAWGK